VIIMGYYNFTDFTLNERAFFAGFQEVNGNEDGKAGILQIIGSPASPKAPQQGPTE